MSNCLQIRAVTLAESGGNLYFHYPFSSIEKLRLKTFHGLRASDSSLSFFYAPYTCSFYNITLGSHVVCKAQTREGFDAVQSMTDCSWNELVIASDNLVLVDFYSPWCGQYPMIEPFVDELAKEYKGKVECYKMNIDDYPNIPKQLGIKNIPAVLLFKDGERKESIISDVSLSSLKDAIEKYL